MAYVVDFDNTIVGNVQSLSYKFVALSEAFNRGIVDEASELARMRPWFVEGMRALVRPHFADFMRDAKAQQRPVFVYTASHPKWAEYIVPIVEEIVGFGFAKPLFTRDDCAMDERRNFTKSLQRVIPRMGSPAYDSVVVVDDRAEAWPADAARLIVCPRYAFGAYADPLAGLHPTVLANPTMQQWLSSNGVIFPSSTDLAARYAFCLAEAKRIKKENRAIKPASRSFWNALRLCAARPATATALVEECQSADGTV